jgi:hypothetical protein
VEAVVETAAENERTTGVGVKVGVVDCATLGVSVRVLVLMICVPLSVKVMVGVGVTVSTLRCASWMTLIVGVTVSVVVQDCRMFGVSVKVLVLMICVPFSVLVGVGVLVSTTFSMTTCKGLIGVLEAFMSGPTAVNSA